MSYWRFDILFTLADSENTAVTLSALLASLNSCCNPWIYMFFSGHLLQDFTRCFPCCHKSHHNFKKEDSDSSFRKSTILTKIPSRSPICSLGIFKNPKHAASTQFKMRHFITVLNSDPGTQHPFIPQNDGTLVHL